MSGGQSLSLTHGGIGRSIDTSSTAQVNARASAKVIRSIDWSAEQIATLRRMFEAGDSDEVIAAALGRSAKGVVHKRSDLKLARQPGGPARSRPDDFAAKAAFHTSKELQAMYRASARKIVKWRREVGIDAPPPRPKISAIKRKPGPKLIHRYSGPKPSTFPLEDSREARAAQFLRWRGFIPVYNARTADARADKDLWIVGRHKMTAGEMIDKATSDPAWVRWSA